MPSDWSRTSETDGYPPIRRYRQFENAWFALPVNNIEIHMLRSIVDGVSIGCRLVRIEPRFLYRPLIPHGNPFVAASDDGPSVAFGVCDGEFAPVLAGCRQVMQSLPGILKR